jgi:hypothetical protein
MKIRKWTFINVHFSKIQNRFEKTLHHSFFTRPPSPFRGPYLYALTLFIYHSHMHTIMLRICKSAKTREKIQKMVRNLGRLFCGILVWMFFGDVLNNAFWHFRRDGAESFMSQMDGPKVGNVVLWNSWMGVFWGCFE